MGKHLPAGFPGLNGDFTLNGKNLSRLLRWAVPAWRVDAGTRIISAPQRHDAYACKLHS